MEGQILQGIEPRGRAHPIQVSGHGVSGHGLDLPGLRVHLAHPVHVSHIQHPGLGIHGQALDQLESGRGSLAIDGADLIHGAGP